MIRFDQRSGSRIVWLHDTIEKYEIIPPQIRSKAVHTRLYTEILRVIAEIRNLVETK